MATRAYRGKHPHRVNTISSIKGRPGLTVITNAGLRYQVAPFTQAGARVAPKPGVDVSHYITSPDYIVTPLDGDVSNAPG